MITEFKIFESEEQMYWFANVFSNNKVDNVYNDIKDYIDEYHFYPTTNNKDMCVIIRTTKKIKNKLFYDWLDETDDIKKLIEKDDKEVDIEDWLAARKYNI